MSLGIWLSMDTGAGESLTSEGLNYTHNVSPMWCAAGVYEVLYESDGQRAGDTLETLRAGIRDMENHPEKYRAMNPPNGWGGYEGALRFLRDWQAECAKHPNATIRVSA